MNTQHTHYTSRNTATAPVIDRVLLPTQHIEKPMAIHEEIRREQVEEIQPVVNIEKLKTEVHQVTQPLYDKEVKSVNLQQKVLGTTILPEVMLPGRGVHMNEDRSTTHIQNTANMVIEKQAIYREVDKQQIIEEIQPVLYKETIIPSIIQETKPVYQKIIEGTTYTQEVLPAKNISGTHYQYPSSQIPM